MGKLNIETTYGKTITDAEWFTNPTLASWSATPEVTFCIGIVTVVYKDIDNKDKYQKYIGLGRGQNEEHDAIRIAEWGSLFEEGEFQ